MLKSFKEGVMSNTNPLQNFLRQVKFKITLPSRGKWYPANTCNHKNGEVSVYAMTAADDTRFKSNDVLMSGSAVVDLIRSCVPEIKDPEQMPTVDLDAVLLSIRRASYGENISLTVPVPNTELNRTVTLNIEQLINQLPDASAIWDTELEIENDLNEVLKLTVKPISVKAMYNASKQLIRQSQIGQELMNNSQYNDEKLQELDKQLKVLGSLSVNTIADSVASVSVGDNVITNTTEIKNFLTQIDLSYFNAIKTHVESQKKKISFQPLELTSTAEEIAAGAPAKWTAAVTIDITNFFE